MTWRVAGSLLVLRDQINARCPGRSKASDGTIGDDEHATQGSDSDHNPWYRPVGDPGGIVTALDVTHDPAHGCDIDVLTDELAATRDFRIKYLIANGLILSGNGGPQPWVWRTYGGSDLHTNHFHLSVVASTACDDTRPWAIQGGDDMAGEGPAILAAVNKILTMAMVPENSLAWWLRKDIAEGKLPRILAKLDADEVRDKVAQTTLESMAAEIKALRAGGSDDLDTAAILANQNAVRDEARERFTELHALVAKLEGENADLAARLAAGARAEADALEAG